VGPMRMLSGQWRGKDGQKDATRDAKGGKGSPDFEGKHLMEGRGIAAGRIQRWVGKRQRPKEAGSRVKEQDNISPSNVGRWIGSSSNSGSNGCPPFVPQRVGVSSGKAVATPVPQIPKKRSYHGAPPSWTEVFMPSWTAGGRQQWNPAFP
jgi:hypothetical protein